MKVGGVIAVDEFISSNWPRDKQREEEKGKYNGDCNSVRCLFSFHDGTSVLLRNQLHTIRQDVALHATTRYDAYSYERKKRISLMRYTLLFIIEYVTNECNVHLYYRRRRSTNKMQEYRAACLCSRGRVILGFLDSLRYRGMNGIRNNKF